MVHVTVKHGREERSYKLEDLLELQKKLMLMSSKGEHGREQVNRFTEVRGISNNNCQVKAQVCNCLHKAQRQEVA